MKSTKTFNIVLYTLFVLSNFGFTSLPNWTLSTPAAPKLNDSFGNPAGCQASYPLGKTSIQLLDEVQQKIGKSINLAERQQTVIWNGPEGRYVDARQDPYVFEFLVDAFDYPLTYLGDSVATSFLTSGFVIWFRKYDGHFHLLAVPLVDGVQESIWGDYVSQYWVAQNSQPDDDKIIPVMKKLPCQWMIEKGYAVQTNLEQMFNFNWNIPDYLTAGKAYLAKDYKESLAISTEKFHYPDPTSVCGPLTWQIIKDSNGFPYRFGNWYANSKAFQGSNPRLSGTPWSYFDPDTYTLFHINSPLAGYDFKSKGNLFPGDIVYSFTGLYRSADPNDTHFDHIFLVGGIDEDGARLGVSNLVREKFKGESIEAIIFYTPGDTVNGWVNDQWNGHGFGRTGTTGFDIFRWKWEEYHIKGTARPYIVRMGDTFTTIGFDWKVSPDAISRQNGLSLDETLTPGQKIILPAPANLY